MALALLLLSAGAVGGLSHARGGSRPHSVTFAPVTSPSVLTSPETASVSSSVSYYASSLVADGTTVQVVIDVLQNSSASSYSFSTGSSFSVSSNQNYASLTYTLSGAPEYLYLGSTHSVSVSILSMATQLGSNFQSSQFIYSTTLGTIWANLTIDGDTVSWSHVFNWLDPNVASGDYAIISPAWTVTIPNDAVASNFNTASLHIEESADAGSPFSGGAPNNLFSTTTSQGQNTIVSGSTPNNAAASAQKGYSWSTASASLDIPSSETAFDISWTAAIPSVVTYNSVQYTGSGGTVTGDAAHGAPDTVTFAPAGDPSEGNSGTLAVTDSFYLSSQYQSSSSQTVYTSSPGYSLADTAGALNSFTGSFSWSFGTPAGDVFADYGGTLATSFTTTITVSNPYSADVYNLESWTTSAGTDTSSSSQGTASPSFTNTQSLTSAGTAGSTISVTLLANTYPAFTLQPAASFVSGSEVKLTFSTSEFFGTAENVSIQWGDNTGSSSTDAAAGAFTYYHTYSGRYTGSFSQTFSIVVQVANVPTPASVPAESSQANAVSYTISATDSVSPASGSALRSGSSVSLTVSGLNDLSGPAVSATVNGAPVTVSASGLTFSISSALFGVDGVNVQWTVSYSVVDTVSASYSQELVPLINSTYCTTEFSNTLLNGLADATVNNTGYQHYNSWQPTADNLSAAQFTYVVPDQFNLNYLTVILNASWVFDYASYSPYTQESSPYNAVTFQNVSSIGTVTFTVTEPLSVGQPLGTVSLGVSPSVALGGYAFFELPAGYLHWTADGVPVDPAGFPAVIGKPVTVLGLDTADSIVVNTTFTPAAAQNFEQLYVNVSEFRLMNENMNETVQVQITNGGTTQNVTDVLPFETSTVYIPSGTYTFHFVYLNYTTGQTLQDLTQVYTVNGLAWWIFKGLLLNQIQDSLNFTRSNISSEINTEQITLLLQDSNIKDLTLGVDINLSATNTSIQDVMSQILLNETFLNDSIGSTSLTLQDKIQLVQDAIGAVNSSQADYYQVEKSIILDGNLNNSERYALENQSGVYAFRLVPEGTVVQPYGVDTSLYVQTANGDTVDNSTLVGMVAANLSMKMISSAGQEGSYFKVLGHDSQSIQVAIYLSAQQVQLVFQNGTAALQMYSPFMSGALSNFAAGSINPSTQSVQTYGIWGTLGLPPPPADVNLASTQGVLNTLAYIGQSPIGKSIYLIAVLLMLLFYALSINQVQRRRHTRYRNTR